MKPFIGIKNIWYLAPLSTAPADYAAVTALTTATGTSEVKNVHASTWSYSQDDPETTEYVNQLTGKPYYRDKTSAGAKTIAFTIGEYEFADKAALQGGTVITSGSGTSATAIGWKSSGTLENVHKAIIAKTKENSYIVFTNALIVGKVDQQELNLGLGVSAVALENETTNVEDEYWFNQPAS